MRDTVETNGDIDEGPLRYTGSRRHRVGEAVGQLPRQYGRFKLSFYNGELTSKEGEPLYNWLPIQTS
jgi:hypothetical protein